MNQLPIKNVKPAKIGNSHYFLIPAHYIKNEAFDLHKNYNINFEENI